MRLEDFDYEVPAERIAQQPPREREDARLLVLKQGDGSLEHRTIGDFPDCLRPGDLLVLNDTRVRPARLQGRKESGGQVEVLFLSAEATAGEEELWSCLVRSSGKIRQGVELELEGGLTGRVSEAPQNGSAVTKLALQGVSGESIEETLERIGQVPLPPYIRREPGDPRSPADRERYQTVFARHTGSAAAPTAGLHLTHRLLDQVRERGVEVASVTLHVGLGTFEPIRSEEIEGHRMHAEWCRLPSPTAAAVNETRRRGGRVVAVGTTVARTLEAHQNESGHVPGEGFVDLFIRPGYRFQVVDILLTNFHVPRSSLLLLVAAFAGRERVLHAYREAIHRGYRFFSYGDAMLILP